MIELADIRSPLLHALTKQTISIATDSATTTPPRLARGGLLCDDMGLGKTIEALALIAADVEERAAAAGEGKGGGGGGGAQVHVCVVWCGRTCS